MKVKVKDLKANPYRNIDCYPLDKDKIMSLTQSIEKTGFWDNLVGRKVDGEIQIAYGHHRVEALRLATGYGYDFEFELPIKDIDDGTMIQIMANENMQEWSHSIGVVDETVKVAKEYLESSNPGTRTLRGGASKYQNTVNAPEIAEFLGWNTSKVIHSLRRLNLINDGVVEKETIEALPTETHAVEFAQAVSRSDVKFTPKEQKEIVDSIVESGDGKRKVKEHVEAKAFEKKYPNAGKNKPKADPTRDKVIQFEQWIYKAFREFNNINEILKNLETVKEEFKDVNEKNILNRTSLVLSMKEAVESSRSILDFLEQ